jgi:hypothetical protein
MLLSLYEKSWIDVIRLTWDIAAQAEAKNTRPWDTRTAELLYGPSVAESLIRVEGRAMAKLLPERRDIERAYLAAGGRTGLAPLGKLSGFDTVANDFAAISGDTYVAVGPGLSARAQIICILAHTLPPEGRQVFQESFVWDGPRRLDRLTDAERASFKELETMLGMGILASIYHARQVLPDLAPEEFAAALLRKYGIPLKSGVVDLYACHWCGTAPCSCGGGKAVARKVTEEDVRLNLNRGPYDTQEGMYFPYAWANTARGGVGYGPFRALVEAATEKGTVLLRVASPVGLEIKLGPFAVKSERHLLELEKTYGSDTAERKALLSELADAVHWQFLYCSGFLDHTGGIGSALVRMAAYAKVDIPWL